MQHNQLNTVQFIERSLVIHNNKYDYSKSNYINSRVKVTIICPTHGEFEQISGVHMVGHGCPKCKAEITSIRCKHSKEEFIQKARKIHGNKYDYSDIEYINSGIKVTIICSKHGNFEQTPNHHLQGIGCFYCGVESRVIDINLFIENCKKIHGNRYDYSKVDYTHNNTKVTIICHKHGEFKQRPSGHLQGKGCPRCSKSKGEIAIENILNKYKIKNEYQYRIPDEKYDLWYDFYLPEYNVLIEFHGKQHYEYIHFFHRTLEGFKEQKKRDAFIKWLAKEKNIPLIEINYKDFKELTKEDFEYLILKRMELFRPRVANIAIRQSRIGLY